MFFKGVCDLHLDNFPYSAHGTLADVMYTGVPHLAMPADTMASRVSSSLLLAGGYPSHLIAYDLIDYQTILHNAAPRLAIQPEVAEDQAA